LGMPSLLVQGGPGFRPRKTKLGNMTPSIGEAAPRGIAVAKAFAQETPLAQRSAGTTGQSTSPQPPLPRQPTQTHPEGQRRVGCHNSHKAAPIATTSGWPTVLVEWWQHLAPHHPLAIPGGSRCDVPDPLARAPPQNAVGATAAHLPTPHTTIEEPDPPLLTAARFSPRLEQ
jgi:hypothetical protein